MARRQKKDGSQPDPVAQAGAGAQPPDGPAPRRAWLVRAWLWLTRPVTGALVTGVADPPGAGPDWRHPRTPQFLRRYLPTSRIDLVVVGEVVVAIVVFVGMISLLNDANERAGNPVDDGELLIIAAAGTALPVLLRDRWPLAAWRIGAVAMFFVVSITRQVYTFEGAPDIPFPAGAVIMYLLVLYAVGVRCAGRISIGVWVISFVGAWILHPAPSLFLAAGMTGAALLYGYNVRVRRQAQRRVVEEEQRTEGERAARAVLEERSRIARELHDVVAHHMSMIAIQAEAAPIKAPADPDVLRAELGEIRGSALAALTELRRVLGVLREGGEEPETAPLPTLADLDQLLASGQAAGLKITTTVRGRPPAELGGIGRTLYRILQESLSNAIRHAPGAAVSVHLAYHPDRVSLRVENGPADPSAPAPSRSRGGQGLTGMRERVGTYGGSLTTGPTPSGGFLVDATVPVDVAAPVPGPVEGQ